MIERIVIPLDGSHRAELAVPFAAYVAAMLPADVELVTVSDKAGQVVIDLDQAMQRSLAEAGGFISTWIKSIETVVIDGDPASALVDHAADDRTMIAMATHGRTGLMRKIAGSVAEGVLRTTRSPVMLIRGANNPANIRLPARISKLLVPLDMTNASEGSFPVTRQLAEKLNAEVTLLYVGDSPDAAAYLEKVAGQLSDLKAGVKTVQQTGDPAKEIINFANSMAEPLVVMCSKRTQVESGPIRGSVADSVIRNSHRPVAVVPYSGD